MNSPRWLESTPSAAREAPSTPEAGWRTVSEALTRDVARIGDEEFVLVEYAAGRDGVSPYGQFTVSGGMVQCEVVSARFLSEEAWPLDVTYLRNQGWSEPDRRNPNWSRTASAPHEAVGHVLSGLRYGRDCTDAGLLTWWMTAF